MTDGEIPTQKEMNALLRAFWRGRRPDFVQVESFNHFITARVPLILGEFKVRFPPNPEKPAVHEVSIVGHRWRKPVKPESVASAAALADVHAGEPIFPRECGLRRLTYWASLFVDVRHRHRENGDAAGALVDEDIPNVYIGDIPIMIGSVLCNLCDPGDDARRAAQGKPPAVDLLGGASGTHMVEGVLDTLILQLSVASNTVVIEELQRSHGQVLLNGHIRCTSLASRYQRYMFGLNLRAVGGQIANLHVRIPSTNKREVPLVLVLLAFDDEARGRAHDPSGTVARRVQELLADFAANEREEVLRALLRENPVTLKERGLDAQAAALRVLNQPSMRRRSAVFLHEVVSGHNRSIEDVLAHEVLPHLGLAWEPRANRHKLLTMLYVLRRIARVHFQYEDLAFRPEACDEPMYERLECDGQLFEELVTGSLRQVQTAVVAAIQKSRFSTAVDLRRTMQNDDMRRKITYCVRSGNLAHPHKMLMGRRGVTQVAGQFNEMQAAATTRKLRTPNQAFGVHLISTAHKAQHVHRVCAVETPEGHTCGSVKHLALFADVSLGLTDKAALLRRLLAGGGGVDDALLRPEAGPLDCAPLAAPLVVLDGVIVGVARDPDRLLARLAEWRRGGVFPAELGFVRVRGKFLDEVRILTDAGRMLTYYAAVDVASGRPLVTRADLAALDRGDLAFRDLVACGKVVPLCAQAAAMARVAMSVRDLAAPDPRLPPQLYNYCAVHPAGIFGLSAAVNIPRAHNNNALRSMFQVGGRPPYDPPCWERVVFGMSGFWNEWFSE